MWGGSRITGQFIIQIAAYSGLEVIAVASERTADLVRKLGANHVVTRDGKSNEQIVDEIRSISGDHIFKGVDTVGPRTSAHCISALSRSGPAKFAPLSFLPKETVTPVHIEIQIVEMKQFVLDKSSQIYAAALNRHLEQGLVKTPELEVFEGGLNMVEEGLNIQKRGDRAGWKVIVSLGSSSSIP